MPLDDGGPFWPCPIGHVECDHPEGASLLDHFAGLAMQGLMNGLDWRVGEEGTTANRAYSFARAMIDQKRRLETESKP